jgi:hypothetical protein
VNDEARKHFILNLEKVTGYKSGAFEKKCFFIPEITFTNKKTNIQKIWTKEAFQDYMKKYFPFSLLPDVYSRGINNTVLKN